MITIRRYAPADKPLWDGFVALSKNATFLHYRDYMDYHSDRFSDFSLMAPRPYFRRMAYAAEAFQRQHDA